MLQLKQQTAKAEYKMLNNAPLLMKCFFCFGKQLLFIQSMLFMVHAIGLLFLNEFMNIFTFLRFNF